MLDRVVDLYASPEARAPAREAIRRLGLPFEWLFAVLLSQGGEFAFVVFGAARIAGGSGSGAPSGDGRPAHGVAGGGASSRRPPARPRSSTN